MKSLDSQSHSPAKSIQFFVYLKDHQQLLTHGEAWLEEAGSKFETLEKRLDALEVWRTTAEEALSEIRTQLRE